MNHAPQPRPQAPARNAMKKIATLAGLLLFTLFAAAVTGCQSYDIDGVCQQLDELDCAGWQGEQACIGDGKALLNRVNKAGGCDDAFGEYLACAAGAGCSWTSKCSAERAALVDCVGEFQTDD